MGEQRRPSPFHMGNHCQSPGVSNSRGEKASQNCCGLVGSVANRETNQIIIVIMLVVVC